MSGLEARFTAAADASIAARETGAPRDVQDTAGREVIAALDALREERLECPDVTAAAHLALDAALEAARIRGARNAIASRLRPGSPDTANLRGKAEQGARAAERAKTTAHDAIDLLAVALGARS